MEKLFLLELTLKSTRVKLEIPLNFPFEENRIPEMTQLIITSFDLPVFTEVEIELKLRQFVEDENSNLLRQSHSKLLDPESDEAKANLLEWERAYRDETVEYNPPEVVGDAEVFAEAYHALVHSPVLSSVLRKESALNSAIREMHRLRNLELGELNKKQNKEMSAAISALSNETRGEPHNTTDQVNRLAGVHFDEAHLVRTRWESMLESECQSQKREFRDWIMKTYQEYYIEAEEQLLAQKQNGGAPTGKATKKSFKKKHSVRFDDSLMISYGDEEPGNSGDDGAMMQESFTIHLGSQMKQMYNIRLLSCHPIDFLRFKNESSREVSPQRLQTAISLYSTDLSGIVLLADPEMTLYNGIAKDLTHLCSQTTEFHFDTMETQLNSKPAELKPGDFIVTRHSNLSNAQVIFHLIADQQTMNRNMTHTACMIEMNSRHPVILGLRNILKTACLNDVTTITIPALLSHEMTEVMNHSWCTRRAELVYKCVKGFMIEMASWGGAEMKNLQFIAPKDISEELFNSLAAMLPNIFRVANPLRLSTSSSNHSLQA